MSHFPPTQTKSESCAFRTRSPRGDNLSKKNVIHGVSPSGFGWAHPSTKTICFGNCIILLVVGVRISMLVHESFLLPTRLKGGGKVKGDINLGAKTKFKKVSPIEGRLFLEWFFFFGSKSLYGAPRVCCCCFLGAVLYGPNFGKTGSYLGVTKPRLLNFETDDNTV